MKITSPTRTWSILAVALASSSLAAQARSTILVGPPALGATFEVRHLLPAGSAGHVAGFLWSAPFAGAVPVSGITVNGLLRVDPAASVLLGVTVANGVDLPRMPVVVPSSASLFGSQADCQSFDLDLASMFQLAGNDLALTIAAGPSAALNMVAIAPGTFVMGSAEFVQLQPYLNQLESQPAHPVTISRPFWIGRFEVTQAQFQAVLGVNPSFHQGAAFPNAAQRPVEQVTWGDALGYCQALTAIEQAAGRLPAGYEYRLPTEAEWEFCCRAGTTTEFHYGPALVCGQANFANSFHSGTNCSIGQTAVVGSYAPNAWGIHDMAGNVWEWCQDGWDGSANYPSGAVTDPFVATGLRRIRRGGSWLNASSYCRSAYRLNSVLMAAGSLSGFRVVLAPVLP